MSLQMFCGTVQSWPLLLHQAGAKSSWEPALQLQVLHYSFSLQRIIMFQPASF